MYQRDLRFEQLSSMDASCVKGGADQQAVMTNRPSEHPNLRKIGSCIQLR